MGDEYAELFAQGLNGTLPLHKLVFELHKFNNINFTTDEVGEQLNRDITNLQIEEAERVYKLSKKQS